MTGAGLDGPVAEGAEQPMAAKGANPARRPRVGWIAATLAAAVLLGGAVTVSRVLASGRGENGAEPAGTVAAPVPSPTPNPTPTPPPGAEIAGPLNLLLVGVDTRVGVPGWEPHADAVMVMHVPAELDRAYLFSLPRDLVVRIPAFEKAGFGGERTKLTHAMSYGSRVPGGRGAPSTEQGFELLSRTVRDYTGIKRFDAGAVLTFGGLDKLVDALGGIDIYVDQRVASIHRRPDGRHRDGGGSDYVGPRMVYEKGERHLTGWQALDYARQRYLPGGDYDRQRHHQQLVRAIVARVLSQDVAADPDRLDAVLRALGDALTFSGGDHRMVDFAFALSGLRPETITMVALPGHSLGSGDGYRGEELDRLGTQFIAALRKGTAAQFLAANPELVVER
jgi:LCP family protein required for cell wall assembly